MDIDTSLMIEEFLSFAGSFMILFGSAMLISLIISAFFIWLVHGSKEGM